MAAKRGEPKTAASSCYHSDAKERWSNAVEARRRTMVESGQGRGGILPAKAVNNGLRRSPRAGNELQAPANVNFCAGT